MRRDAREVAFKLIFGYLFKNEKDDDLKKELLESPEFSLTEEDVKLAEDLYTGVIEHFDELQKLIEEKSVGFRVERIYKTDMAVMLLAAYEINYRLDIPKPVSVNEAVELAKKYGAEKSASFINGVLASIVKG